MSPMNSGWWVYPRPFASDSLSVPAPISSLSCPRLLATVQSERMRANVYVCLTLLVTVVAVESLKSPKPPGSVIQGDAQELVGNEPPPGDSSKHSQDGLDAHVRLGAHEPSGPVAQGKTAAAAVEWSASDHDAQARGRSLQSTTYCGQLRHWNQSKAVHQ